METDLIEDIICPSCGNVVVAKNNILQCTSCNSQYSLWKHTWMMSGKPDFYYGEMPKDDMNKFLELCEKKGLKAAVSQARKRNFLTERNIDYIFSNKRASFKVLLETSLDKVALDFGCGLGIVTHHLALCFKKVYAVDMTKERAEFTYFRTKQSDLNNVITLCAGDKDKLPFKDGTFDCIVLNGVLEWVAENKKGNVPDIQNNFLAEIGRILKNTGMLYVGIENRFGYNYFKGIREDHTGLRFGSLLPRPIANQYSMFVRKKPYRTYTYSWKGYKDLLRKSKFAELKLYLPGKDYRYIDGFIDPHNLVWVNNYFQMNSKSFFKSKLKSFLSSRMHPTFSILAKKKGKIKSWINECCQAISNHSFNGKPYRINNFFITQTETCIVELEILNKAENMLIVKIPLNKIHEKICCSETLFLKKIHDVPKFITLKKLAPEFVAEGKLHGIKYFVQGKIPGNVLFNDAFQFQHKKTLLNCLIQMHIETKHFNRSELFKFTESELSHLLQFLDSNKRRDAEYLIGLAIKFDDEANNIRVFSHGDMWTKNILWDHRGQLQGIVDWGEAQLSGLPLLDLIHVLYYEKKLKMHISFGELFYRFSTNNIFLDDLEQSLQEEYCRKIFGSVSENLLKHYFFIYTLYHILKRIPYHLEISLNERWIENNFFHLNKAAEKL